MRKFVLLMVAAAGCISAQSFDFSSLDKLASRAKEANEVNLDANQIRAALQLMSSDDGSSKKDEARRLLSNLQRVMVRNYEFSKAGEVQDADLQPIRTQLAKMKGWAKIVDSREKNEHSEIYVLTEENKTTGLAVINVEPRELNVVVLRGLIELADLQKLHGAMGLPNIQLGPLQHPPSK